MEEDFDLTQTVTVWSDEEDQDTDTDQVALLKVFKQTGVPSELEFTLFKGVNKIGRSDSCEVCIKNKVLSKEHAAIEVGSDWFLICDLGSANKTWRCKKHLKPNVKYKLEPNEELIFGNIRTQFVLLSESKEHEETDSETGSESMLLTKEATQTFPLAAIEKDIDEEKHLQKDITSSQNNLATNSERISLKSSEGNKDSILAKPDRDSSIKTSDDETDCESSEDYEKIEKQGTNFSPTLIDNLEIDAIVNMKCKVSNSSHLTEESSVPVQRIVENVDSPIAIAEERKCINTALDSSGNLPETFPESLPGVPKFINVCHLKNYHQADQSMKISAPDFSPAETFEDLPITQINMDLAQYVERSNICDDSNNPCPSEVGQVKKVTNSSNFCNEQNNNHCYEARTVDNEGMPPTQPKVAENQVGADVNKWNELNDDDDLPETQVCGAINKSGESDEYDDDLPETQVCSTVNTLNKSEDNNDLPITQICVNKSYELDNADKNLSNLSDSELPQTIPNFVALECNIKSCLPCSHKNDLSPVGPCTVTNPSNLISSFNSSRLGNAKMVSTNNDTNAFGESSTLNPYKKQIFSGINISIEEEDSLEKDISVLCPSTQRRSDSKEGKVKNTDVYGSPNLKATDDEGKDSIAETPPHLLKECNTSSESSSAKKGISCIRSLFKRLPDNAACFSQSQELNDFCSSNLETLNELYFRSKANVTNNDKGHSSTRTSEHSEVFVITGKVNYASNCSPKVYKEKLDVFSHDQISIKISPEKLKEINNNCGSVIIDPSCNSECSNRGKNCEKISAFLPLEGSAKKVNTGVHEVFDNLNQVHNEIQDSFYRTYSRKKCANKSANSTTPINNKEQGANSDTEQKQTISKRKSKRLSSLDSKPVSCLPQKTEIAKTKLIDDSSSKEDSHSKVNLREISLRSTQNSTALASHHKAEKNYKVNDSKGTKLSRAKKRSSRVHGRLSNFEEIQNPVHLNENSNVTGNDHNSAINALIAVEENQGGEDYSDCPSPTKKRKKKQTNLKKNYTSVSTPKSGVSTRGFCAFKSVEMDMSENKEFQKKLSSKQVCEVKSMGTDSILIKSKNNFQDNGFSPFKKDGLSSISTNTENIYSSQPLSSRTRSCKSNNISVNKEIVIAFDESFPCMKSKNKISVQSLIKNVSPRLKRSQIKEKNKPVVTVQKLPMSLEFDSKPIRRTRNSMCSTETSKPEVLKSKNESNTLLKIEKRNISLNAGSKSVSDNKKLKKGKSKGCKRKEASNETHGESVTEENESISCVHQENSAIITNLFCKPQELAKNVAKKRVDKTKLTDKSSIDLCKDLPKRINKRKSVEPEHTKSNLVKQEPEHFIDSNNVYKLSSENFSEKKCSDKSPHQLTKNSNISQKFVSHVEDNSTIRKRTIIQACCNGNKQIQEVTVKKNRTSDTSKNASDNISETFATPVKNRRGQKSNNRSKSKVQFISPVSKTFQSSDKPKVMFTMVEDEDPQKIVVHLGGKVTEDFNQCTQLVTDKLRRTVKALCCIAKGIPLVNTRWLQQCKKVNSFVDHTPFLIKDKTAERQHGFSLQTTLKKFCENHLLTAWSIHVTPKVQPPPEQMKDIIQCADGKYLPKMPNRLSARTVIISCASDLHLCSHAAKCGIPIVSAEFLLTGLLRYEINIKSYELT